MSWNRGCDWRSPSHPHDYPAEAEEPAWLLEQFGPYAPSTEAVLTYPDSAASWTAKAVPGEQTGRVLTQLQPEWLSATGRVDYLIGLNRQIETLRALEHRTLAVMKHRAIESATPSDQTGKLWIIEDIRAALRISGDEAHGKLVWADTLTTDLPTTMNLLSEGRITNRQAHAL
jgi:hypothetical protein